MWLTNQYRIYHVKIVNYYLGDKDNPLNLEITAKHLQYFDCLNRGGLTYPSNLLFSVLQCA